MCIFMYFQVAPRPRITLIGFKALCVLHQVTVSAAQQAHTWDLVCQVNVRLGTNIFLHFVGTDSTLNLSSI